MWAPVTRLACLTGTVLVALALLSVGGGGAFAASQTSSDAVRQADGGTLHAPNKLEGHPCGTAACTAPFVLSVSVPGYSPCDSRVGHQTTSGTCMSVDQVTSTGSPGVVLTSVSRVTGAGHWCDDEATCSEATSQQFTVGWPSSAGDHPKVTISVVGTGYQASSLGWNPVAHWGATATIALVSGPVPPAKTSLAVAITTTAARNQLSVGDETAATVKVTAAGGAVSAVSLGSGLTLSSGAAAVTSSPSGLSGFSLAKGESRSFVFKLKAAKAGPVTLHAAAKGRNGSGDTVSGSASLDLRVGAALTISVVATPTKIAAPGVERASTRPVVETVKVTLANPTRAAIDGVQVISLTPVPVDHTKALKKLSFTGAAFPLKVGTIAPGGSTSRTFTLDVSKGLGSYQVEALALFNDPSAQGGNGRAFAVGGQFEVVPELTIEGTIKSISNCSADPCPSRPLSGATVTAVGANGSGQATTGKDGTYSIGVPEGTYMVTSAFQRRESAPSSRSVTVHNSAQGGVDFAVCANRIGAPSAKTKPACQGPVLEVLGLTADGKSINIKYRGTGWDPEGGPIGFSFSGNSAGQIPAQATFEGVLRIAFWPKRTTVDTVTGGGDGAYCWGELVARQGTSLASTGIVKGKWAGWVLWSADPRIHAREAWCNGEADTLFRASPHPIVAFGFWQGHDEHGISSNGLIAFNLSKPGDESPTFPLLANRPITIGIPSRGICLRITGGLSAVLNIATTRGSCT
ncbi:MAG TPA: carboxypeptidase-like regulatory domain-containing protein [Gaiellaceae bacterium]|jgi:hypothetical protein|nr:carboxypeptidase-like regulatory domain-containing protein [Gaiellaceae bacterium]